MLTKARILGASAVAWFVAVIATLPLTIKIFRVYLTLNNTFLGVFVALIVFFQNVVYRETRRYEKKIPAHQISAEARKKSKKGKKALKITTSVISFLLSFIV